MIEVTREDVAYKVSDALAPLLGQQPSGPTGADFAVADALIAAFPHLVGEVVEIDTEHSTYDLRTPDVYKVYAPWREAGIR